MKKVSGRAGKNEKICVSENRKKFVNPMRVAMETGQ
jgi:hypothetical protein